MRNTAAMVTRFVRYEIDPTKIADFERFARRWIALVNAAGGAHHGYFLPSEGASDVALALFTFPSFASYDPYRGRFGVDPDFVAADGFGTSHNAWCATSAASFGLSSVKRRNKERKRVDRRCLVLFVRIERNSFD